MIKPVCIAKLKKKKQQLSKKKLILCVHLRDLRHWETPHQYFIHSPSFQLLTAKEVLETLALNIYIYRLGFIPCICFLTLSKPLVSKTSCGYKPTFKDAWHFKPSSEGYLTSSTTRNEWLLCSPPPCLFFKMN